MANVVIITNAPEEYDVFSTETVEWLQLKSRDGKRLRKVTINQLDLDRQRSRYMSGLYEACTEVDFEQLSFCWEPL